MQKLMEEIRSDKDVILFIDGNSRKSSVLVLNWRKIWMRNIIKPKALARGELQLLGLPQ